MMLPICYWCLVVGLLVHSCWGWSPVLSIEEDRPAAPYGRNAAVIVRHYDLIAPDRVDTSAVDSVSSLLDTLLSFAWPGLGEVHLEINHNLDDDESANEADDTRSGRPAIHSAGK